MFHSGCCFDLADCRPKHRWISGGIYQSILWSVVGCVTTVAQKYSGPDFNTEIRISGSRPEKLSALRGSMRSWKAVTFSVDWPLKWKYFSPRSLENRPEHPNRIVP